MKITTGYIVTATRTLNNKNPIYKYPKLHILVMLPNGKKDFVQVDHKNRNKKDNRKNNLRVCALKDNSHNRGINCRNTSGFTGVHWHKKSLKWRASIVVSGKYKSLGAYDSKENAIKARLKAELKYFGEFAPQRHLFEQYKITEESLES